MIPASSTAAFPIRRRRRFPFWIPILPVWLLTLPIVLMLAPLVLIACLYLRVPPFHGVAVYWQLFNSLRCLRIEVNDPRASTSIRIF